MLCCPSRCAGDLGVKDAMVEEGSVGGVAVLKFPEHLKLLWDEGEKDKE